MKIRYIIAALAIALIPLYPARAEAPPVPPIVIAAIQTTQEGLAGNDFVVLHNMTDEPVDITGWRLQYRSAAAVGAATWTTKRTFACIESAADCKVWVEPRSNIVASTYTLPGIPSQPMATGFSDTGGQLRLARTVGQQLEVIDRVGYGAAAEAEGSMPAAAPVAGEAVVRKQTELGTLVDTDVNASDFTVGCYEPVVADVPAAVSCDAPPVEPPEEEPPLPTPDTTPPAAPEQPTVYGQLIVTELLPDPASPATDSADEFIELHNPGTQPVDAEGYTLQAGADFRYQFTLGDIIVPPGGYVSVFSAQSHLSLTNSGTSVRIVDPAGVVMDTVASYGQAKSGQAWAKGTSGWQWTALPTPGAANVFGQLPAKVLATAAAVKRAAKTATKKPAAAKTAKAATAKKPAKTTVASPAVAGATDQKPPESTIQYFVLAGVALLILAYAVYEYRQSIARSGRNMWRRITRRRAPAAESTLRTD